MNDPVESNTEDFFGTRTIFYYIPYLHIYTHSKQLKTSIFYANTSFNFQYRKRLMKDPFVWILKTWVRKKIKIMTEIFTL